MDELQDADPRQIGPYMLTARLGAGGMGLVYLGQSAGGRLVAVKVIHSQLAMDKAFRVRFEREIAAARRVGGFYTAPVVDADTTGPQPWLAVGYVDGPSLDKAVSENGPMPQESLLILAAGLAEGLGAVHAACVIHRDLKPSNVMLAPDGVRVIDFGIARAADDTMLTGAGQVIGSPWFMSPEQASGHAVGPASDVFSMGGVLVYAATGEGPFGAGWPAEQLFRVVHGSPRLDGLPPGMRALVAECMDKDPARRPTAGQFLARLPKVSRPPQLRPSSFEWWPATECAPPESLNQPPADEAPAEQALASNGATRTVPRMGEQPALGESPASLGSPAPPRRRAGRRRLRWAIPVIAVMAAAILVPALLSMRPAPPLPVLRPTGLAAVGTSYSAISINWSGPRAGPQPDTYEILQDGAVVGSVPGYRTRYRRTGLSPATSYRFQVIAVRGATRSPPSDAANARTGTPPLSDALFSHWTGTARSTTTSIEPNSSFPPFGGVGKSSTDPWKINAGCDSDQCGANAAGNIFGNDFTVYLSRDGTGTTYTGTATTGPLQVDYFSGCYRTSGPADTLSIQITVTHASPTGGLWGVSTWSGSATWDFLSSTTCAPYTVKFALHSS